MSVVEAVKVVGEPDRVDGDRVRAAPLGRLADDSRELGEALDELALLGGERQPRRRIERGGLGRLAEDAADPRVDVLDVVDRVLARPLDGEVDVDLDRLVVAAVDRNQRAKSTPTSSRNSSRKTTSPRRFDIFACSPPRVRWTSW